MRLNGWYKGRVFAHEIRMQIFKEHFGATDSEVQDPVKDSTWNFLSDWAFQNQEVYYFLFKAEPDDRQINYQRLQEDREELA